MNLTDLREHHGVREWGYRAPLAVRLLRKVAEDSGCWVWEGATADGYGRINVAGRLNLTHRVSYELFVGPVPAGLTLDHLCRRRDCLRTAHLEPVDSRTNTLRGGGVTAINAAKAHCNRGHAFDADNTRIRGAHRYCLACIHMHNAARRSA